MTDRHPTKIVQIAATPTGPGYDAEVYGLDADGSLWLLRRGQWEHIVDSGAVYAEYGHRAEGAGRSTSAPENSPGGAVTDGREGEGG